jgi:FkbM family methyltransferase
MKKIFIRIFRAMGIYDYLVNKKGKLNENRFRKQEKKNSRKRTAFYSTFLKPDDLVFDVGANIGNRVESFLEIGCKVIAVEPQQECIKILNAKFGSRIKIIEKGLGAIEEEKTFYIADVNTISSFSEEWINSVKESRFNRNTWSEQRKIQLTTLDQLIKQFGTPAFCKIDVEGYELEVLKGLTTIIPRISLEYTVPEQTANLVKCLGYCNDLSVNYKYNYSITEDMIFQLENFLPFDEFISHVSSEKFINTAFGDIYVTL